MNTRTNPVPMSNYGNEFESYLISALNDSLIRKSKYGKADFKDGRLMLMIKNTKSERFMPFKMQHAQIKLEHVPNFGFFFFRSNKESSVYVLVGREWREESYCDCFPTRWTAP